MALHSVSETYTAIRWDGRNTAEVLEKIPQLMLAYGGGHGDWFTVDRIIYPLPHLGYAEMRPGWWASLAVSTGKLHVWSDNALKTQLDRQGDDTWRLRDMTMDHHEEYDGSPRSVVAIRDYLAEDAIEDGHRLMVRQSWGWARLLPGFRVSRSDDVSGASGYLSTPSIHSGHVFNDMWS